MGKRGLAEGSVEVNCATGEKVSVALDAVEAAVDEVIA